MLSKVHKAYLAGFLDGDGSIYVRAKPNRTYRFNYQIAAYVVLFQSSKDRAQFEKLCSLINLGYLRERNDGILEYIIGRVDEIEEFLKMVSPFVILKQRQIDLMFEILRLKRLVKTKKDFAKLLEEVDRFRSLNYSKKRKKRILTP